MLTYLADLLTRRPFFGFASSILSITLTHLQVLQIVAAVLGIVIAVITAVLKVMELREKLAERKENKPTTAVRKKPGTKKASQ